MLILPLTITLHLEGFTGLALDVRRVAPIGPCYVVFQGVFGPDGESHQALPDNHPDKVGVSRVDRFPSQGLYVT